MSRNVFLSAEGMSEASAQRPSAAQLHDWRRQPPRINARDIAHQAGVQPATPNPDAITAALSAPVRIWENGVETTGGTDERGLDERWGITINILGQSFAVELGWWGRFQFRRFAVRCAGCNRWKYALYLVGGQLLCRNCGGVRAQSAHCPSILKPAKTLTRAETAQLAERKRLRDRRKWARVAGAQVFPEGATGCEVAQTFEPVSKAQSNDGDTDD